MSPALVGLAASQPAFQFSKSGGAEGKGKGVMGLDDDKYIYKYGLKIKADTDDKYQVVRVTTGAGQSVDLHAANVGVWKMGTNGSTGLRSYVTSNGGTFVNDDNETVSYVDVSGMTGGRYYLVNTSGNIQKSKVAAKDGDDWYFYVKDRALKLYTSDKNLDVLKGETVGSYTAPDGVSEKWDSPKTNTTVGGVTITSSPFVSDLTTGN